MSIFTNKFSNIGKTITSKMPLNELALIGVIILFTIMMSSLSPSFLRLTNLLNLSRQISTVAIISVGACYVICCAEVDLSVGSTLGMTAVIMAALVASGYNYFLALIIGLLSGTIIGVVNGVLVTKVKIPSLIATLGTLMIGRGIALTITGGWPIMIYGTGVPQWFQFLGGGRVYGVPMQAVLMVIILIIGDLILRKTSIGYHLYAVGGNPRAAMLSGISADKIKIFAFAITGFLASIAGVISLSFIQSAEPNMGFLLELDTIAVAVIGGASFAGGRGSIVGVLFGALIMGILFNGLVLLGVSPYIQKIFIGLIIIIAVASSYRFSRV